MMDKQNFQPWDYVIFISCLVISVLIGVFSAFSGGRQKTTKEYLMANRNVGYGPASLSLLVTIMSAITILGVPAEIYLHGTGYGMFAFSYFLFIPIAAHGIIPVLYDLHIISVYEYLEMRFSKAVRLCGTASYIVMMVVYMGVVIYAPALAVNAVTDLNVWVTVFLLCVICTLYTAIGGLKAVIWTDVFQAAVMLISQLVIIGIGCHNFGGPLKVWNIVYDAKKIAPINLNPSPLVPHTFWSTCIGGTFLCLSIYCVNQAAAQRFLCCRSKKQAKLSIYLNFPLLQIVMIVGCSLGLLIFVQFRCKNPLAFGARPDQLLLYYVMFILKNYPGLPGLFIGCLFCASLSTVSSCFNSLATVTIQDLIRPNINMSDRSATKLAKLVIVIYALLSLGMTAIASQMDSILKAALSILGIIGGPVLSLFLLGIFVRRVNSTGALVGFCVSLLTISWLGFGSIAFRMNNSNHQVHSVHLDTSCNVTSGTEEFLSTTTTAYNITSTSVISTIMYSGMSDIYKISYMWYSVISVLISSIFAIAVSLCTEKPFFDESTVHFLFRKGAVLGPKADRKQIGNCEIDSTLL
uniref:Sodium-dependent multivitamin transporter-like n=1 Tax=Phallusia mammillata TaxID=59560 RepID=A0A6F9DS75_9ASCI|nr:sodium-dependent multivitamin transporter-like [Phallusia mammillata]